jgi:hypothetical protein
MSDPSALSETPALSVSLRRHPLLSIASTLAISWGSLLLLSALVIGTPVIIRGNRNSIIYILIAFLLPSILLLVGGIAIRRLRRWASGLVFGTSAFLIVVSLLQLLHGVRIATLGMIINFSILSLLYIHSLRVHHGDNSKGV